MNKQDQQEGPGAQAARGISGAGKALLALGGIAVGFFLGSLAYRQLGSTEPAAVPVLAAGASSAASVAKTEATADPNARACAGITDCRSVPWAQFMKLMKGADEVNSGGEVLDCTDNKAIKPVGEAVDLCACQCKPAEQVAKK